MIWDVIKTLWDKMTPGPERVKMYDSDDSKLYPPFEDQVNQLLKIAKQNGLDVKVIQGLRTFAEQKKLFDQGRTTPGKKVTNARPGYSFHNYGLAVDIVFLKNGKPSWSEEHDWNYLGEIGRKIGLRWGGDFKKFKDRPHFEYNTGLRISDLLHHYKNGGINNVWREV